MNIVFEPGDLVLVRNFSRRKLDPFYTGEIADRNVHQKNLVHYYTWYNQTSGDEVSS